jgi:hypothetical protein
LPARRSSKPTATLTLVYNGRKRTLVDYLES